MNASPFQPSAAPGDELARDRSARAEPLKSESPMPNTEDEAAKVEALAAEMGAAAEAIERYLAQLNLSRGIDKETIHGFHVGTDREAELKSSDLRTLLASHTAQGEEIEELRSDLSAANRYADEANTRISTLSTRLAESEAREERLTIALDWALEEACAEHPHYPEHDGQGGWQFPYLVKGDGMGGGVGHEHHRTALEAVEAAMSRAALAQHGKG